jgi:hypothetical protein
MAEKWLIAEWFRGEQREGSFLYPAEDPSEDVLSVLPEEVSITLVLSK